MGLFVAFFRISLTIMMTFFLSSRSWSAELWIKKTSTGRDYVTLSLSNQVVSVKSYHQEFGDFQYKISQVDFKLESEALDYINFKFEDFEKASSLSYWPVLQSQLGEKRTRNKVIWEVRNQWSDEWENKYSQWITDSVKEDFFQKYKLSTDCADAVVGLRWIFARINGLPMASTLADTSNLFSNVSMPRKWKKIPTANQWYNDELFLTALSYVMDLSSTRTIVRDGYPVALTRKGLRVGTFILTQNQESNHVKFISENNFDDPFGLPLYTLTSTTPRQVRALVREVMADQDWPVEGVKSFMAFRSVLYDGDSVSLKSIQKHSDYSLEQYDPKLKEQNPIFIQFVLSRVKTNYDPQNLIENGIKDIVDAIQGRIKIVEDGYAYCSQRSCPNGSSAWDDWSTPSRDSKLLKKFEDLDSLVQQFESLNPGMKEKWNRAQKETSLLIQKTEVSLYGIHYLFSKGLASSDPNVSIIERWGLNYKTFLSSLFESLLDNLKKRKANITNPCFDTDCFPKNNLWLSRNTFHIDLELKKIYADFHNYCEMFNLNSCAQEVPEYHLSKFDSGTENLTLTEWLERVPFFSADPTVIQSRRWGILEDGLNGIVLPVSSQLFVSENQMALVDKLSLMDLKTQTVIHKADLNEDLYLTSKGKAYLYDRSNAEFSILNGAKWEPLQFESLLRTLINFQKAPKPLKDQEELFLFSGNNKFYITKLNNREVQLFAIADRSEVAVLDQSLLFFKDQKAILFDLLNKQSFDLDTLKGDLNIKTQNLILRSYQFPLAIFDYNDVDADVQFPVVFNLAKSKAHKIDLGRRYKIKLTWSSAEFKKLIIEELVSEEFPQSFSVELLDGDQFNIRQLDQMVTDIIQVDKSVYFNSLNGGRWDQQFDKTFYQWNGSFLKKLPIPAGFKPSFISKKGLFYSRQSIEELGQLVTFDLNRPIVQIPSFVLGPNESCQWQKSGEDFFTYRLAYQHGDYRCMGKAVLMGSDLDQAFEISLLSSFDPENNDDLNWTRKVEEFAVKSGFIESFESGYTTYWWVKK